MRSSTQPIGVSRSAARSGSMAPETIKRSIALVIAVVEAEPLGILLAPCIENLLEAEHWPTLTASRMNHPKAEAAVREGHDLVGAPRPADVSAGVGDDHVELESLGAMDREEPNGACTSSSATASRLLRPERLLFGDEP